MSPVPMTSKRVYDSVNPEDSPTNAEGYVGVDPVYQNHANETDAPLEGEDNEGPDEDAGEVKTAAGEAPVNTGEKKEWDQGDPETGDASSKAQGTSAKSGAQKAADKSAAKTDAAL